MLCSRNKSIVYCLSQPYAYIVSVFLLLVQALFRGSSIAIPTMITVPTMTNGIAAHRKANSSPSTSSPPRKSTSQQSSEEFSHMPPHCIEQGAVGWSGNCRCRHDTNHAVRDITNCLEYGATTNEVSSSSVHTQHRLCPDAASSPYTCGRCNSCN